MILQAQLLYFTLQTKNEEHLSTHKLLDGADRLHAIFLHKRNQEVEPYTPFSEDREYKCILTHRVSKEANLFFTDAIERMQRTEVLFY